METTKTEGKRRYQKMEEEEEEDQEDDDNYSELGFADDDRKKRAVSGPTGGKRGSGSGGGSTLPYCQVDDCNVDLSEAKRYYKRHKVCEFHAKATTVFIDGSQQRFCQQCSRFHEVSEFDDTKRSCRRRLAGHNSRRRKSSSDFQGDCSV